VLPAGIDCKPLQQKRSTLSGGIILQLLQKILVTVQRSGGLARLKILGHETLLLSH
jgi:hypothetical protein